MATLAIGPAVLDLTGVRAGDRNLIAISITSGGAPYNLTGFTITGQARNRAYDAGIAVSAVVENISAVAGTFTIRWPGDAVRALFTADATAWVGVWDLQIQKAPEDPITVAAGAFAATLDVTRP